MDLLFSNGSMVYIGNEFSGIYGIQNQTNGKWYVGESIHVTHRIKDYIYNQVKGQKLIYRALKKYGIENFSGYKLEECPTEQLSEREVYWGTKLNSMSPNGYNLSLGTNTLKLFSDEMRLNMSNSAKSKPPITNETRKKLRIRGIGQKRPKTEEWKKRHSDILKGRSPPNKGKKMTMDQRKKISNSWIKRRLVGVSDETRLKRSIAMKLVHTIKWLEKEAPWFCETT